MDKKKYGLIAEEQLENNYPFSLVIHDDNDTPIFHPMTELEEELLAAEEAKNKVAYHLLPTLIIEELKEKHPNKKQTSEYKDKTNWHLINLIFRAQAGKSEFQNQLKEEYPEMYKIHCSTNSNESK